MSADAHLGRQAIAAVGALAMLCASARADESDASPRADQSAHIGVAADALSTAAALTLPGAVEINPLGWTTVPIRLVVLDRARSLPPAQRQPVNDAVSAVSWGASTNNLLLLTGRVLAGPMVGVVVGVVVWKSGERQREFLRLCTLHHAMNPAVECEAADVRRTLLARAS